MAADTKPEYIILHIPYDGTTHSEWFTSGLPEDTPVNRMAQMIIYAHRMYHVPLDRAYFVGLSDQVWQRVRELQEETRVPIDLNEALGPMQHEGEPSL